MAWCFKLFLYFRVVVSYNIRHAYYKDEIVSILSNVHAWTSAILVGKRDSYVSSFNYGFSKIVVVVETTNQLLDVLSFCDWERA